MRVFIGGVKSQELFCHLEKYLWNDVISTLFWLDYVIRLLFNLVFIVMLVFFHQPWSLFSSRNIFFIEHLFAFQLFFFFFTSLFLKYQVQCRCILTGCLSAVFLRPTQVKWQLMVASCYRRSGENDFGLHLSWHDKIACYRLFSANQYWKPDHTK